MPGSRKRGSASVVLYTAVLSKSHDFAMYALFLSRAPHHPRTLDHGLSLPSSLFFMDMPAYSHWTLRGLGCSRIVCLVIHAIHRASDVSMSRYIIVASVTTSIEPRKMSGQHLYLLPCVGISAIHTLQHTISNRR